MALAETDPETKYLLHKFTLHREKQENTSAQTFKGGVIIQIQSRVRQFTLTATEPNLNTVNYCATDQVSPSLERHLFAAFSLISGRFSLGLDH